MKHRPLPPVTASVRSQRELIHSTPLALVTDAQDIKCDGTLLSAEIEIHASCYRGYDGTALAACFCFKPICFKPIDNCDLATGNCDLAIGSCDLAIATVLVIWPLVIVIWPLVIVSWPLVIVIWPLLIVI
jgi:hypothetical protein